MLTGCANGRQTLVKGDEGYIRNPLVDYDILVQTFNEHYGFFEHRGINNWDEMTEEARKTLTEDSTDEELLAAFQSILQPLKDGHVMVTSLSNEELSFGTHILPLYSKFQEEFEQQELTSMKGPEEYLQSQLQLWTDIVGGHIEGGKLNGQDPTGLFGWGKVRDANVGYLRFLHFMPDDMDAFAAELDTAFQSLLADNVETMVIDIRWNLGGTDVASLLTASHFFSERTLGFTKRAVIPGGGWTEKAELYIDPAPSGTVFEGNVVMITSQSTVSAGETFILSMLSVPAGITFVGRTTAGILSDQLPRFTPDGWFFGLSNEEFAAADGTVYEGVGCVPDIKPKAELLPLSERKTGVDSWLEAALIEAVFQNHGVSITDFSSSSSSTTSVSSMLGLLIAGIGWLIL